MGLFGNVFGGGGGLFGQGGMFGPPQQPPPQSFSMPQTAQTGAQFGIDPTTQQSVNQAAAMPVQTMAHKPGFNDPGGWGERLGGVAAALRDDPKVLENYQNLQLERQKLAMLPKQAQMQAYLEMMRHQADRTFDNQNPAQSEFARTYADMVRQGDQAGADRYRQAYQMRGGGLFGPTITDPATGQQYASGAAPIPAAQGIHPEAIARLRQHPEEAQLFDQQFGAGAAASVLGGPTPPASGTFPR